MWGHDRFSSSASAPSSWQAVASVCQFYPGEPVCKTVEESYCVGGGVGVEGQVCRKTTEYWYWS